MSLVEAKM